MNTFDRCAKFVLDHEGGLVNDPNDPGGRTKYGISQRAYPRLDIESLTQGEAVEIYRHDYWHRIHGEELPPPVALVLFDTAVNSGPARAIKFLQEALGLIVDGVYGRQTAMGVASMAADRLATEILIRRQVFLARLMNFSAYGHGWTRRIMDAHAEALAMAWGR